jgi:peptide/nickel transport system substrate-binding protein
MLFVKDVIKGTALEDRRVRLAMNYAVDKETISKTLYAGFSEPLGQLTVPGDPAYNPSVRPIPFDTAQAKRLLAEAGYPNGFRIAGGFQFVPRPLSTSVLTAVQSMHRDVGIIYDLVPLESGRYVQIAFGTGGADKARTEFLAGDGSNNNGIWTFPWGFLKCDQPAPIYCNPPTDTAMFAALQETDAAKRNAHLQTALKAWSDEVPMVFLVSAPQFTLATTKVQGFEWTTQVFYYLDGIYKSE